MEEKRLAYSAHASDAIGERELAFTWIVRTIHKPEWILPDPRRPGVERRYRAIPEHGNRILRVVVMEKSDEIRIITAFFDRRARRP
ncbi:DUF4258 domain-containing protein [Aurantimonas aggregata]|uniref:DUF4258 domain-containing protein n=1 Tax=Aurantimonas aggregata TaxID=2047720 RepID=A0A6L9MJ35_9HYPH|nr:DUF4258 domain-containing protein [Aurantimonas aggregata]NDV87849.1 DUF4258 domain-containing protein [Aurantimonas aggregata]